MPRKGDSRPGDDPSHAPSIALGATEERPSSPDALGSDVDGAAETGVATASQTMTAQRAPEDDDASLVGAVLLDRYQITRKIGQGGMGAVYEAQHTLIGKRVAVKVLLDKFAQKEHVVARLEQEARLASSIGHEHIIDITDFGQTPNGRTFVVMEFLEGESLSDCLARTGPLPLQRSIRIARQVASALGAAHEKGIVHRDVKPENVFLLQRSDRDFVKVVDFGISKSLRSDAEETMRLTQTGMVLGTPLYMSPEQARGDEELDHRVDIYSLGVILYEMVTGEVPFKGSNYLSVISQVVSDPPRSPRALRAEVPTELDAVILHALDKEPRERYQEIADLEADLGAFEAGDGSVTTSGIRVSAPRRRPAGGGRRLRAVAWGGGIAFIAGGVALAVSLAMSGPRSRPARPAAAPPALRADAGPPPPDAAPTTPELAEAVIHIETIPPGATIYADDGARLVGEAPVPFHALKRDQAVWLVAEKEGYEPAKFRVVPRVDDGETVPVRLRKPDDGRASGRTRPPRRRPAPTGEPDSEPEEGKPDDTAGGELTGNPYRE